MKPPSDLSTAAKMLWKKLRDEYGVEDGGGLSILLAGLRSWDRAEEARKLLDEEGIVLRDRWGQAKPHPAASIERDARAQWLQALKALNLDVEPLRDGPGRPPGRR